MMERGGLCSLRQIMCLRTCRHYSLDSLELFRAASHVILAADQLFQRADLVALTRRVDIADGDRRSNAARDAVQETAEIAHLPVVHY